MLINEVSGGGGGFPPNSHNNSNVSGIRNRMVTTKTILQTFTGLMNNSKGESSLDSGAHKDQVEINHMVEEN